MPSLELEQTEDLLRELCKRYMAIVIVGAHDDDPGDITQVVEGPVFMVAGLVAHVTCANTATMTKP